MSDADTAAVPAKPAPPTFQELCLSHPLYAVFELTDQDFLARLRYRTVQFDGYCTQCGKEATFKTFRSRLGDITYAEQNEANLPGKFTLELHCTRDSHKYIFEFYTDGKHLIKYGQLPSLEDIVGSDIQKYGPLLRDGYFAELKRAGGLASHGIGIGAFVYLRRIFERLIADHRAVLEERVGLIPDFDRLRMAEKIDALKEVLPSALVRHRATYGILSKGLHELDENTCRRYFPVVRAAIIQILDQDLRARAAAKEADDLERAIAKLAVEVNT